MFLLHFCLFHILGQKLEDFGSKPNIIFFMADDLGWNNVEWHNSDMKTPNAFQLLKQGVKLDRKYAYPVCSPSRSSFMSGRLPFHVQQQNFQNCDLSQGVPRNMTFISAKLKTAGYSTHATGKWHLGTSSAGHTPKGRGFDSSLIYFEGAEDHWTQRSCNDPECIVPVDNNASYWKWDGVSPYDLWLNNGPAKDLAGSGYNGFMFSDFAVDAIQKHDQNSGPMFLYLATANSHTPLEVPQKYLDMFPEEWYLDRRQYAAMCAFWDEVLGNVTSALKQSGMWENTLFVFSSDNGGPVYWSLNKTFPHGAGANNWPLRGSKASGWEGGIRVASFISGGFVPESLRGSTLDGYIHMADWYSTFCHLAGVDPTDDVEGLPGVDSLNMWPYLSGQVKNSPRTEIPVVIGTTLTAQPHVNILIKDQWKIMTGNQVLSYWQGPQFPNHTSPPYGVLPDPHLMHLCLPFCLYNIQEDPTEQTNLAKQNVDIGRKLLERVEALKKTMFERKSNGQWDTCRAQTIANGHFYGPWLP